MWQGGLIQPLFALGLSRNSPVDGSVAAPSYLAFGGLPPVDYDNSTWTRTPILGMQSEPGWGSLAEVKGLYIISADAHVYGEWNAAAPDPTDGVVVDGHNAVPDADRCGSSVRYYRPTSPRRSSFAITPQHLANDGSYYAPCDVRVPAFGVRVDGEI